MNIPSELMLEYILRAFAESPLSSYVEDVQGRTDETLPAVVQDTQKLGARKEAEMKAGKVVDATVNTATAKTEPRFEEKDVPPSEMMCPV